MATVVPQDTAHAASIDSTHPVISERHAELGVDLLKYPSVWERETYEPIAISKNRELYRPILKGFADQLFKRVPDPVMLTHIVTTRCNYSCGFCSFADTLNAKTNELSLEEIEKTYASIGQNLNVIVYSGGETTLNRNLPEIIEAAYRLTPVKSVYIISNAWKPDLLLQITHRVLQRCPDLHLTWSLSIEGTKPTNNATRYTKAANWDAWQNTIDAMEGLKAIRERFDYEQI
jgi:MoaA/NifB/PqqE/SkfB family radical SAM enzyme